VHEGETGWVTTGDDVMIRFNTFCSMPWDRTVRVGLGDGIIPFRYCTLGAQSQMKNSFNSQVNPNVGCKTLIESEI
jgi:hypothetical protein